MSKAESVVSRGTKQIGQRLLPWIFPILLLVVWQIASSSGLLESRILPAPTAVISFLASTGEWRTLAAR